MHYQLLKQVLTTLNNDNSSTLYDLVLQTLRSQDPAHQRHHASLLSCILDVLDTLSEQSTEALATRAIRVAAATYQFKFRMVIYPQKCLSLDMGKHSCHGQTRPSCSVAIVQFGFCSVFRQLFRYRECSNRYENTSNDGKHCPTLYLLDKKRFIEIHAANLEILKE